MTGNNRKIHELQLPSMYEECVYVYEVVNSRFPGYFFLQKIGELCKSPSNNGYIFCSFESLDYYLGSHELNNSIKHGPAYIDTFTAIDSKYYTSLTFDTVPCVLCFEWPTQVADWPIDALQTVRLAGYSNYRVYS